MIQNFADAFLEEGTCAIGLSCPVVPVGKSRVRVQISGAHGPDEIAFGVDKFGKVGKKLRAT